MNNPVISIIIPIYNVEAYLPKCLDSVLSQTFTDFEVICVNDGSPDGCPQICDAYAKEDSRIRVIHKKNGGLSDARNVGVEHAVGKYIMFVDSDDWLDEKTLEIAYAAIEEQRVDVVLFAYKKAHPEHMVLRQVYTQPVYYDERATQEQLTRRFVGLIGEELQHPENADSLSTAWGKLYRADIIRDNEIKFIDTKEIGTEDALFNLMTFSKVKTALYLPDTLYYYRENSESLTGAYNPYLRERWKRLFLYMRAWIAENECGDEFGVALNNRIALSVLGLGLHAVNSGKKPREIKADLRAILKDDIYIEAYKKFSLKHLSLHWKAFYGFAKYKCVTFLYWMLLLIRKIRSGL